MRPASAIVFTKDSNLHEALNGILSNYTKNALPFKTKVLETPSALFASLEESSFNLLVLDDRPEAPATYLLRLLNHSPRGLMTPTLVFLSPWSTEDQKFLLRLGVDYVLKPMTPSSWEKPYKNLLQKWQDLSFQRIQRLAWPLQGEDELFLQSLGPCGAQGLSPPLLALSQSQSGRIQEAETTLLASLRTPPWNLRSLMSLGTHYVQWSMFKEALSLFSAAHKAISCGVFYPDLVQIALALGEKPLALNYAREALQKNYLLEEMAYTCGSLLASLGDQQGWKNIFQLYPSVRTRLLRHLPPGLVNAENL